MLPQRDYARALEPLLVQASGYARSILRNRADAEDAVQTAALRGLERLGSYDELRPFKAWWFAILRNCCIDTMRRAQRRPTWAMAGDVADERSDEPAPDWEALDRALETLSDNHREIVRLRYFADLSYAEIAEALSIPAGTVMSRLYHARLALAATLQEETR
ncbi:RNA polymerase sigma factor [Mesorhizobium sp. INR15]|uniref:RNA polymerase sigma factor n=1 Tax=Mesorhizobium sp. INR15 TaxID=2654248 RepID=UPI001896A385|nr:RNA polymerase sigma factor [Mesorhizobium sp. INR15]QPC91900.1 sigma-70 family RNA polymerase sigma factor [Mesorhizobium sp. INR15]